MGRRWRQCPLSPGRLTLLPQLELRRRQCWPALRDLKARYRGDYAYASGTDPDGPLPLCRLRWTGSPDDWGFACWLAGSDRDEESVLPTGGFTSSPEDALDCALRPRLRESLGLV